MGKLILEKNIKENNFKINLTDQPTGIYLIKLYSENTIYSHKIIKK